MKDKIKDFFNNITPEQWKNIGIITGSAGLGGLAGGTTNLLFQPRSRYLKLLNVLLGAAAGGTLGGLYSPLRPAKIREVQERNRQHKIKESWERAKKEETFRQDATLALNTILPGYFIPTAGDSIGKGATVSGNIDSYYDMVDLPTSLLRWATNKNLAKGKLPSIVKVLPKDKVKSLSKSFRNYMTTSPRLTKTMGKINAPLTKIAPIMSGLQTTSNIGNIVGKAYDTVAHREDRIKADLQNQELQDTLDWGLTRRLTHNFVDNAGNVGRDVVALKGLPGGVKNPLFSGLYTGRTLQNLYDFGAMTKDDAALSKSYNTGDLALDRAIRKIFKRETGMDYGPGIFELLYNAHADKNGKLSAADMLWMFAGGDSKRMTDYEQKSRKAHGTFDWKKHSNEISQLAERYRNKKDPVHTEDAKEHQKIIKKLPPIMVDPSGVMMPMGGF